MRVSPSAAGTTALTSSSSSRNAGLRPSPFLGSVETFATSTSVANTSSLLLSFSFSFSFMTFDLTVLCRSSGTCVAWRRPRPSSNKSLKSEEATEEGINDSEKTNRTHVFSLSFSSLNLFFSLFFLFLLCVSLVITHSLCPLLRSKRALFLA